MSSEVVQATALLIVFIHGFKGSADTTFEDFPNRLAHMLGATHPELTIESVVYPTYDTKGRLDAAVDNFIEWLTEKTLEYESKPMLHPMTEEPLPASQTGRGGGAGSLKIIIAGHSMGGLVGVDAALAIARSATPSTASEKSSTEITPIWPRVCGVIAYDTPYFGVHPNTFKHGIGKVSEYVQAASALGALFAPMGGALAAGWGARQEANATGAGGGGGGNRSSPTSPGGADGWASWAFGGSSTSSTLGSNRAGGGEASTSSSRSLRPNSTAEEEKTNASAAARSNWSSALYAAGGAAILAGGAAAFMKQQQIREGVGSSYNYVQDHLAFVGNLWDPEAQRQRLDSLVAMPSILFHCFYTEMPASRALGREQARTFIILPPRGASSSRSFTPMMNSRATDEVDAHVTMFSSIKNPSYFHLGTKSASIISEVLADEAAFGQSSRAQAATDEEPEVAEGLRQGDRGATTEPPSES
ncbi:unnamed protein product [Tilletia controversa]|uniref:DUF676 domain-containing protein n=1 Tax=Tilletia controversa TaxID=13291 RepID=A0A8X7MZS0_9BASI|nr:hypothetical protein CF328_g1805 [Tilletia controversa]KAE8254837.1 hypothetical protein A4X06_0g723 [Tilletia controversa]CAD6975746.1 unnamed protein product [Tilletia controversa]